jgi:hypothetical protein
MTLGYKRDSYPSREIRLFRECICQTVILCTTELLLTKSKVWWHAATHFLFIFTDIQCLYIGTICRVPVPSCCRHGFCSVEGLLWGAEPRFELGPALQQADALLYEPRRTLNMSPNLSLTWPAFARPPGSTEAIASIPQSSGADPDP